MAKHETIVNLLSLLFGSGLDYTPKPNAQLPAAWSSVFSDISDAALTQAVHDYLKIETKWPAPAKLRELAEKIQRNHSASIFADPSRQRAGKIMYIFHPETGEAEEVEVLAPVREVGVIPGVYTVTGAGWMGYQPGTLTDVVEVAECTE